jgi:2-keto-4-pentenoate hydratase/2-oxohepta-3-ene-1,7-dioic acid hydratase in catechol pathway
MKLCRFQLLEFSAAAASRSGEAMHPEPRIGRIEGDTVHELSDSVLGKTEATGRTWKLTEVALLPPSVPTKIVCVGRNYVEHAAEFNNDVPKEPLIFLKPPSAIIAPGEPIVLPAVSNRVDYEGELCVVIARRCRKLPDADDVRPYIAGYTCLNDVSARDLQFSDPQWTRAKGFDTFCPFGPVLETDLDLKRTTVETFVNGVKKQSAPTTDMIFSIDVIIRWISRVMTFEPGDIIATGTPSGVGPLAPGDVVEVVVSGVGTLRNPVEAAKP